MTYLMSFPATTAVVSAFVTDAVTAAAVGAAVANLITYGDQLLTQRWNA